MPLKASVGLSRKIGQENYGSLGANCQLEIELDASIIDDAEAFHARIRRLYALANQSVVDQLTRGGGSGAPSPSNSPTEPPANDEPASNKQVKYLLDIARQQHDMDLARTANFCEQAVGVSDVYQLTKSQASTVIDRLNGRGSNGHNGNGRRRNHVAQRA